MRLFLLPDRLRRFLANLHVYAMDSVKLYAGPINYVGIRLRAELYPHLHKVAAVGDVVCTTFIEYVGVPRICIADGRTLRRSCSGIGELSEVFKDVQRCRNPSGSVSGECLELLNAVARDQLRHLVLVDGEEDLLALAVALQHSDIDYVVYGVPQTGVAIIDVNGFRVTAINLFSQFLVSSEV